MPRTIKLILALLTLALLAGCAQQEVFTDRVAQVQLAVKGKQLQYIVLKLEKHPRVDFMISVQDANTFKLTEKRVTPRTNQQELYRELSKLRGQTVELKGYTRTSTRFIVRAFKKVDGK